MSTKMETLSLRPKFLREETDLKDPPRRYMEPHEIKVQLYLRECEKLSVIPVSAYIRQTNNKSLTIGHYNIGPNGARALAAAILVDNTLTCLDIEGNSISPVGLSSIKEALIDNIHVTTLNIADNKLGSRGANLLGLLMMSNHCIETLDASRNGFGDQDADIFGDFIKENRVLRELVLSGNEFEEIGGCVFGSALAVNENLEVLDLSWNHIRKRGALEFAQGMKENVGLRKLNVSFNGFGTEGTAFMGQALVTNRTLVELDMSKNRITNMDMTLMAKQLKHNETLQILRLGDNLMNALGAIEILKVAIEFDTTAFELIDFGTTCVDQGFLQVQEELKKVRPDVEVRHGRIQSVYLDLDMAPPITPAENPDQALTEYSGISKTPLSAEKGKTYVVDGGESRAEADDTEQSGENIEESGNQGNDGNKGADESDAIEFDEKKLDDEVSAVTGKPAKVIQKPLADDRGSAGTLTPDI